MRTIHLVHSTFSWLNDVGYDPYNTSPVIMRVKAIRSLHC